MSQFLLDFWGSDSSGGGGVCVGGIII